MSSIGLQNYTDSEIYEILDLVNPSDSVLEARIIQVIEQSAGNDELTAFFMEVYNRFFDDDDDGDDGELDDDDAAGVEGFTSADIVSAGAGVVDVSGGGAVNVLDVGAASTAGAALESSIVAAGGVSAANAGKASASMSVNTLEYKKDYINPILKQTIKRVICIDSQYRNLTTYSLSTDFTVNLSEPLRDVVQLSLYSVHIPLTWYTVSNSYGANFFYLKATSAGINTGYYDYIIDISSGNYSQTTLVAALNASIAKTAAIYTDVSFGTTALSYNSSTSNASIAVGLSHLFNENNYTLTFADWTTPTIENETTSGGPTRYNTTLPAFLGYNFQSYTPNTVYSTRTLPSENANIVDTTFSGYVLDASNNYFTVYQYLPLAIAGIDGVDAVVDMWQGAGSANAGVMKEIEIKLSLAAGSYNRNTIFADLNTQLAANTFLSNSAIVRKYSLDQTGTNTNNSFYALSLNLNTKTTQNVAGAKLAVVFPTELDGVRPKIWTIDASGSYSSCFSFLATNNDANNIVAETNSLQSNYIIDTSPFFVLVCTTTGYTNPDSGVDYSAVGGFQSWNDYIVKMPNRASPGYSLSEYLAEITTAFSTTNAGASSPVFNTTYTFAFDNAASDNRPAISIDLNKLFTTSQYNMDLSGSYLYSVLGLSDGSVVDLETGQVQTSLNNIIQSSYSVTGNLMQIYPKTGQTGLTASCIWDVPAVTELASGLNLNSFVYYVNESFKVFSDEPNSFPLLNTVLSYTITSTGGVNFILTVNIQKFLTQNDYNLVFYDPLGDSWSTNLSFNTTYDLSDNAVIGKSYSTIYGNSVLAGYTFSIAEDTSLTLTATGSGVATTDGVYDVTVSIPAANSPYTRGQLFDLINTALAANVLSAGSYFTTSSIGGLSYVVFRANINKIFTAADYNLVWFDPYSFVKCYSGVSSVRNVTWDSTIGWTLGFRTKEVYVLADYYTAGNGGVVIGSAGGWGATIGSATITGDTAVTTTQFNYFLIILDDYSQSHLNDGLVTLTSPENDIPLPSYASKTITCASGNSVSSILAGSSGNRLTQNQIYAASQIYENSINNVKTISSGPFIQDIFGFVPMKTSGLANGATYVEFGGTLQNQNRVYFGPVNIHRISVKLINDRGDVVDLNGSNWSFSFICEQLYQQGTL